MIVYYPDILIKRFKLKGSDGELTAEELSAKEPHDILEELGRNRGLLISGGDVDSERAARLFLKELRGGVIGKVSLERPEESAAGWTAPAVPTQEEL